MKNILVPVDFSSVGDKVIELAGQFAKCMGAKLWLVHVAAPDPDFVGFKTGPKYVRQQLADVLRKEHAKLQEMAETLRSTGHDAQALLVQGPTTETLCEEVARLKADLVIMGSHGHSGLFKAFIGSVCEQMLAACKVPVLIVPSPERP